MESFIQFYEKLFKELVDYVPMKILEPFENDFNFEIKILFCPSFEDFEHKIKKYYGNELVISEDRYLVSIKPSQILFRKYKLQKILKP